MSKSVYILLTNTGSLFSTAIGLYTRKKFNHVSLVLDDCFDEVYSFGRVNAKNPVIGGFVNEIETQIYRYFKKTSCLVLKLELSESEHQRLRELIDEFEKTKVDYHYNLIGFVGFLVDVPIRRPNAFFCSQFVHEILRRAGVVLVNKPSELVTPSHFLNHPLLEEVYHGPLTSFLEAPNHHLKRYYA